MDRRLISYFNELCSYVEVNELADIPGCYYTKLLEKLFDTPFRSTLWLDENRAFDAAHLKERIAENLKCEDAMTSPVNVLEVLLALAMRIEDDIMYCNLTEDRVAYWFWTMIYNLGLMDEINENFNDNRVRKKLNIFLDRKYGPDGLGSIFFTNNPARNFLNEDLWMQAQLYFAEFYD